MPVSKGQLIERIKGLIEIPVYSPHTQKEIIDFCSELDNAGLAEIAAFFALKFRFFQKLAADKEKLIEVEKIVSDLRALNKKYGISS